MPTAGFLLLGVITSLGGWPRSPWLKSQIKPWGSRILQWSVVLLGARIPISELLETGRQGLGMSLVSVGLVIAVGLLLSSWLKVPQGQSVLITSGTAICGGSAIAAVAPAIQARSVDVGVSIAIVFILNAIAAIVFPPLGKWIGLTDSQFATWSALAIHDTSSVVAASAQWSEEALRQATTIKLSRTLWIFPIVILFSFLKKRADQRPRWNLPWFIVGFVLLSVVSSQVPWFSAQEVRTLLQGASHWGFSVSLFLIGNSIPREQLKTLNARPVALGIILWLLTLSASLLYVML